MTENPRTIKDICEAYGISQTELSKKYGIPLRTVQDWHGERRKPPAYVVNMIVELLATEEKLNAARWEAIQKMPHVSEDKRKELQARLDAGESLVDLFKPNKK